MGISYRGRTYAEGKKIGVKDGVRALYCVLKYNLHNAPWPIQFFFYIFIGGASAIVNLLLFLAWLPALGLSAAALLAFFTAAAVNYYLSVQILFRRRAKWSSVTEMLVFLGVVAVVSVVDLYSTRFLVAAGFLHVWAKAAATAIGLLLNFAGRRLLVFPEKPRPDWKPQG
jgi:dolichol-phosphate mannosyltransferase